MAKVKTAKFNGVRFDIDCEPVVGVCDHPKGNERPAIRIPEGLKDDKATLDILLHECLHACNWEAREKKINQTAGDLSRFLWRLGYKLTKEK